MLTTLKEKNQVPTFIPNPDGQLSNSKTSVKLRKAHLRWKKAQKARRARQTGEEQLAYWSKMCAARSF